MSQVGPVALSSRADAVHLKVLLYGASGAGKTVFCCASQQFNTFVFDVDDGAESAAAFKGDPAHGTQSTRKDNVVTWRVTSAADFDAAFAWLSANSQHFQLVVLDTATELQRLLLGEICKKNKQLVPNQACWGEILVTMENIARSFRHLPFHVIWTAHEKGYEDKDMARVTWRPNFSGDFAIQYAKHFGEIWRYVVSDNPVEDPVTKRVSYQAVRAVNTSKDGVTEAKDRSQGLDKWEIPNIDSIFSKAITAIQTKGETTTDGCN
jgi:hypothetical protein